jgi:hypothetical protein
MKNYYLLSGKNSLRVASAYAPEGTKLAHELIPDLEGFNQLPFEMELIKLTVGKNGIIESNDLSDLNEVWLDYQPNSLAFPLMSEKLKSSIERNLTGKEGIEWIFVFIRHLDDQRTYYIPKFSKMLDVLDIQKTMFVNGTNRIIRPVFSLSKVSKYNVFHQPSDNDLWTITPGLYASESVKKAIQKEKLSGISFEKTSVA